MSDDELQGWLILAAWLVAMAVCIPNMISAHRHLRKARRDLAKAKAILGMKAR